MVNGEDGDGSRGALSYLHPICSSSLHCSSSGAFLLTRLLIARSHQSIQVPLALEEGLQVFVELIDMACFPHTHIGAWKSGSGEDLIGGVLIHESQAQHAGTRPLELILRLKILWIEATCCSFTDAEGRVGHISRDSLTSIGGCVQCFVFFSASRGL